MSAREFDCQIEHDCAHLCSHTCIRGGQIHEEIDHQSRDQNKHKLAQGDFWANDVAASFLSPIPIRKASVPALDAQAKCAANLRIVVVISSPNLTWLEPLWSRTHSGRGRASVVHSF
jgi:hypothetical protein